MRETPSQAGADPEVPDPMAPGEPRDGASPPPGSHAGPAGRSGTSGPRRSPRDPRVPWTLTDRDLQALARVGRAFELAQYQLHEWVFPGRVESIVSRFVHRMAERGLLAVDRLGNGTGMNRLRLTARGRGAVVAAGVATEGELFVPRSFVALKDLAHTYWVNDVCLVLETAASRGFDTVRPAWALQRAFVPPPAAIPDVLAVRRPRPGDAGLALAIEVDLGGERLKTTFVPKLTSLAGLLATWAGGVPAGIVVFTRGVGRAEALKAQLEAAALPVPAAVELLPVEVARPGLKALRVLLRTAL